MSWVRSINVGDKVLDFLPSLDFLLFKLQAPPPPASPLAAAG